MMIMENEAALRWPMIMGRDGYRRPGIQLTADERAYLIETVHILAHDHGYSQAQIKDWLTEHGAPRSAGTISLYLAQRCERCPDSDRIGAGFAGLDRGR
jgi:hypothetical protein